MAATTTTLITPNVSGYYDRRLLDRLVPNFVHLGYGDEKPVPKNQGTTITFRRYTNLSAATTALTEGVTPGDTALAKTDVTATLAQYGAYVTITDWLDMTGLDKTAIEAVDLLADQAGDTHDQLCRDVIVAGTQVWYSGASAARTVVDDKIKIEGVRYAQNILESGSVKPIKEKITGGTNYGSKPVDPGYIGIAHTDARADIEGLSGFIAVRDYAQPGKALPGEIGAVGMVRFILTPNAKAIAATGTTALVTGMKTELTGGTYADVYMTVIFGQGAYGNSRIGPAAVKSIVKSFGSAGTEDPLEQRSTVGWKSNFVCKLIGDARIARLEHACTDTTAGFTT